MRGSKGTRRRQVMNSAGQKLSFRTISSMTLPSVSHDYLPLGENRSRTKISERKQHEHERSAVVSGVAYNVFV